MTSFVHIEGQVLPIPVGGGPTVAVVGGGLQLVTDRAGDVTGSSRARILGHQLEPVLRWPSFFSCQPALLLVPSSPAQQVCPRLHLLFLPFSVPTKLWSAYLDHDPFLTPSFPFFEATIEELAS